MIPTILQNNIICENYTLSVLDRLLTSRGIALDDAEDFLDPLLATYWKDPFLLNDMQKGVDRLIQAIRAKESICIFGDYDVDGVTSSFLMYTFIKNRCKHDRVTIMYPDRLKDGYGMKVHHVDTMHAQGHTLVITVDNGITSVQEMVHATNLGMDVIITDHHKPLEILPPAYALINPQVSPNYPFKGLCGAAVAMKFICACMTQGKRTTETKREIYAQCLSVVAIATVADCVPLVDENRALVKKGLDYLTRRETLFPAIEGLLDFLNLREAVTSYHIGFVIGPRINAGGRLASGYDSVKTLLLTGTKQVEAIKSLDDINTTRRKLQEEALKKAETMVDHSQTLLHALDPSFHEGIVGIVAGRLTEKYYKPSVVLHRSESKGLAVGSLRGPAYFDVMQMMLTIQERSGGLLAKFGGHKQAGGMSAPLEHIDTIIRLMQEYCTEIVPPTQTIKMKNIDTIFHPHERHPDTCKTIDRMQPRGHSNLEPIFLFPSMVVQKGEKIGQRGQGHCKLTMRYGDHDIDVLYRSKGDSVSNYVLGECYDIIGKVRRDEFKRRWYVVGE